MVISRLFLVAASISSCIVILAELMMTIFAIVNLSIWFEESGRKIEYTVRTLRTILLSPSGV